MLHLSLILKGINRKHLSIMKNLVIAFSCLLVASCSTASTTPNAVIATFNMKFPNASKVKWIKENKHEFEANFVLNREKYSANFSDDGTWLETEREIDITELPVSVLNAFNAKHKDSKIKAIAKIETSKNDTNYEIEITQGIKTVEYFFDQHGNNLHN